MAMKERLKKAMEGPPKVTAAELARACGVKAPSVSDWLSGRTVQIKGNNLNRAAARLGVSPLWLGEGKGPMRPKEGESTQFAPLYEDQLSSRGLRIMARLLDAEVADQASNTLYALLENALALAGTAPLVTDQPVTTDDITAQCDRLTPAQRTALAAFLSTLSE